MHIGECVIISIDYINNGTLIAWSLSAMLASVLSVEGIVRLCYMVSLVLFMVVR